MLSGGTPRGAVRARFYASWLLLAAMLAVCALHAADLRLYEALTALPDGFIRPHPFYDLRDILRGGVCWRRGVDVYAPSACMDGGVFNYAPLLLRAAILPIGVNDRVPGGILCCLVFIASLSLLPAPKSIGEFTLFAACALSTSTMFALELANFDLVIFALVAGGLRWICWKPSRAIFGYAPFVLAAACKFYPAALFGLILREPLRRSAALTTGLLLFILVYALEFGQKSAAAIAILPQSLPFRATFGALDLPNGLDFLKILPSRWMLAFLKSLDHARGFDPHQFFVVLFTRALIVLGLIVAASNAEWYDKPLKRLEPSRKLFFLAGALIIAGCYDAAQNVEYRGIFLLLTIPGLWRMAAGDAGPARNELRVLLVMIPFLLWEAVFRAAVRGVSPHYPLFLFWVFRECLWWWVAVQFTAMILCFAASESGRLYREAKRTSAAFFEKKGSKKTSVTADVGNGVANASRTKRFLLLF